MLFDENMPPTAAGGKSGLVPPTAAPTGTSYLADDGTFKAIANASAATNAEAAAGASTTTFLTPAGATLSAGHAGRAPRPGIISTGASAVGTTQDNAGLAFGTGNLTIGAWVRLADWTPGVVKYLMAKNGGATVLSVYIDGSNRLAIEIGASAYHSTATLTVTDGAWAYLAVTIERSGNATWYINGAAFGTAANISGSAATTLTGTGALTWLSSSAGGSLTAGTIGETFIISGLLTATNIAEIYKAGSIAPFSASFTFFQWCDFGQGYGPIIKDRSGQNQPALMGTSGLTHAVPHTRQNRNPVARIVGDGSAGSFVRSTLTNQSPTTGDFTLTWEGIYPQDAGGTSRVLAGLSPNPLTVIVARSFFIGYDSGVGLFVFLFGATTSDQRYYSSMSLHTALAAVGAEGIGCRIIARRSSSGVRIFIGIGRDTERFYDVTNLFTATVAGSAPAWTDTVSGDYLSSFLYTSSYSSAQSLFDLNLMNVALTEAQLRTEYERGEPGLEWQHGSQTALITGDDSTFASATGFWSLSGASITGGKLVLAGAQYARTVLSVSALVEGGMVKATITITDWASGTIYVQFGAAGTPVAVGAANGTFTVIGQAKITGGAYIYLGAVIGAATANVDTVAMEVAGYTSRLRTDTAAGLTALDGSSNKNDFLLSTTGVTTSPNGRRQIIRPGTLTFGSAGTQQLFGASTVDTGSKWRVVSVSGTSNASVNLSLGNTGSGTQYISAQAVTAADFDIGTFASRVVSGANLYLTLSGAGIITDPVIILEKTN